MTTVVPEGILAAVEAALEELTAHVRKSLDIMELHAAIRALEMGMAAFTEDYGPQERDRIFLSMRALHAMTKEKIKRVEQHNKTLN